MAQLNLQLTHGSAAGAAFGLGGLQDRAGICRDGRANGAAGNAF
jgi:hypothetical protein